jgi:hypothetical protein
MQIILLEKVGKLGNLGDVVKVKEGYARNFLIPSEAGAPRHRSRDQGIRRPAVPTWKRSLPPSWPLRRPWANS